ncbi:hypothetical protein [Streptomyces sp. NPDC048644]|uniref:hypothetical protein n=1 Tax=Streptomyces sp. NPDC048644 TaxID=3365582 RepID=UPI003711B6ED
MHSGQVNVQGGEAAAASTRTPQEAVTTATHALDQLAGVHSERSVQALRDFCTRLAPMKNEPMVREFERKAEPLLGAAA